MQPEAQTTTRGFLANSEGALEIAIVIQGALKVFRLYLFNIYSYKSAEESSYAFAIGLCFFSRRGITIYYICFN